MTRFAPAARFTTLAACLLLATPAIAPAQARFTVEKYLDYEQVSQPQLSPDGARIVFSRGQVNRLTDRWDNALWVMNADGSRQ
ncbi:MAG: S9 family peptidase, partial [Gemmatimonadaceae bacterium]